MPRRTESRPAALENRDQEPAAGGPRPGEPAPLVPGEGPLTEQSQWLGWLLSALAATVVALAIDDQGHWLGTLATALGPIALSAGWLWGLRRWRPSPRLETGAALALCLLAGGLAWGEIELRRWSGVGLPLELRLLLLLRNEVLMLAALSWVPRLQWLGSALSLFLVLFAASTCQGWASGVALLAYVMAGCWWLMGRHWDGLRDLVEARTLRQQTRRWGLALPLLIAVVGGLAMTGGYRVFGTARGAWGGSGGDAWHDPDSRGGVHDGDALVAATRDAASFGPVESEIFMDSETPSLYDVFNDQYGDPPKIRQTERAVALPPGLARETEQRLANATEAAREFSVVREPRQPPPPELADREGPALLAVLGRTPWHARLEVYDLYDGRTWWVDQAPVKRPALQAVEAGGQTWLRIPRLAGLELIRGRDLHTLRINRLETNRVPTPWHPSGVRIDRVDRPDFFEWSHESVLAMTRESLPRGIVLHWQSQPRHLSAWTTTSSVIPLGAETYRGIGTDAGSAAIAQLAREWTAGLPPGIAQIAAIERRLRSDYRLDRDGVVPADTGNAVAEFLLHTRAGPDYQFAGGAVLLLRSLGYSARLVSGFYVRPDRYDARRRQTPVLAEDVHFWPEVYVGANTWLELEPTPGYELLEAEPTWLEWLTRRVRQGITWMGRHPGLCVISGLGLVGTWWRRRTVLDLGGLAIWWGWRTRDPRRRIVQTLNLLNRRQRWFGPPIPVGSTQRRRLTAGASLDAGQRLAVEEFLTWADWAAYGGRVAAPGDLTGVEQVCRRVQAVLQRGAWSQRPEPLPRTTAVTIRPGRAVTETPVPGRADRWSAGTTARS